MILIIIIVIIIIIISYFLYKRHFKYFKKPDRTIIESNPFRYKLVTIDNKFLSIDGINCKLVDKFDQDCRFALFFAAEQSISQIIAQKSQQNGIFSATWIHHIKEKYSKLPTPIKIKSPHRLAILMMPDRSDFLEIVPTLSDNTVLIRKRVHACGEYGYMTENEDGLVWDLGELQYFYILDENNLKVDVLKIFDDNNLYKGSLNKRHSHTKHPFMMFGDFKKRYFLTCFKSNVLKYITRYYGNNDIKYNVEMKEYIGKIDIVDEANKTIILIYQPHDYSGENDEIFNSQRGIDKLKDIGYKVLIIDYKDWLGLLGKVEKTQFIEDLLN